MKLENQVTNLELSKKLERLGVKQESVWYWVRFDHGNKKVKDWALLERKNCFNEEDTLHIDYVSAFTVAELGEMLPDGVKMLKNCCSQESHKWTVSRFQPRPNIVFDTHRIEFEAETEADARAKMLIYLIENKLI